MKLPSNLMPDILHHEDDFIGRKVTQYNCTIAPLYPSPLAGNIANANFPLHKQRVEETLSPGGSNSSLPQLVTLGQREKKEKEPYNVLLVSNLQVVESSVTFISITTFCLEDLQRDSGHFQQDKAGSEGQ